jgi:hypothetical protein
MLSLLLLLLILSFAWAAVMFINKKLMDNTPGYSWIGYAALILIFLLWLVTTLGANH